jgi:hypothetical protein
MLALLTQEQEALRSMVEEVGADIGVTAVNQIANIDRAAAWQTLAQTGLLELRSREPGEDPPGSGVEVMVAAEALGGALAPVPYLFSGVLAVELLAAAGGQADLLAAIGAGTTQVAIALSRDLRRLADPSELDEAIVIGGADASSALVVDKAGTLFTVPLAGGLVELECTDLLLAMHHLANAGDVEATSIGSISEEALIRWQALALSAVTADAAGALGTALRNAVEYSKVREAFGAPIGTFQAMQHLMATGFVDYEAIRSTNNYAAWGVDELEPAAALLAARTAKAYMSDRGVAVAEAVMQLFGGIGQTWENTAHLYARRVMVDAVLFGDADYQFDAIAAVRIG